MLFRTSMICLSGLNLILPIEVFIKVLKKQKKQKTQAKYSLWSDLAKLWNAKLFLHIQILILICIRCNHCFNRGRESDPEIPDDPAYKTSLTTPPVHRKSVFWEGIDKKWAMSLSQCPCILSEFGVSAFSNHNNCRNYLAQMLPITTELFRNFHRNNREITGISLQKFTRREIRMDVAQDTYKDKPPLSYQKTYVLVLLFFRGLPFIYCFYIGKYFLFNF